LPLKEKDLLVLKNQKKAKTLQMTATECVFYL